MYKSGLEELKPFADSGYKELLKNFKVLLTKAIREIDSAKGNALQSELEKTLGIISDFQNHISTSELIKDCDKHGEEVFEVSMSIGDTLGGALEQMKKTLEDGVS